MQSIGIKKGFTKQSTHSFTIRPLCTALCNMFGRCSEESKSITSLSISYAVILRVLPKTCQRINWPTLLFKLALFHVKQQDIICRINWESWSGIFSYRTGPKHFESLATKVCQNFEDCNHSLRALLENSKHIDKLVTSIFI